MKIYYDSFENSFYVEGSFENLGENWIEIEENYYNALFDRQEKGLAIMPDKNGYPINARQGLIYEEWKNGKWVKNKELYAQYEQDLKEEKRSALIQEKQSLFDELRLCDYLDEKDEAKEIALKIKELDSKIEAL